MTDELEDQGQTPDKLVKEPGAVNADDLLQGMAELTNTIKEHGEDTSTLDMDQLKDTFGEMLEDYKLVQEHALPDRAGLHGGFVATDEGVVRAGALDDSNRYKQIVKNVARDGQHKFGSWRLTGADLMLAARLVGRANHMQETGQVRSGAMKNLKPMSDDLAAAALAITGEDSVAKLLTSTGAGTGDELVPTGLDSQLWEDFFAASRIVNDMQVVPMPTDPFDVPLGLGDPTWRKGTEGTPPDTQDPSTAKSTLTSTEQILDISWTYDLDELAVIAMMPALRALIARTGAEQMDNFALNADGTDAATGNINLDDADPDSDAYYLSDGDDGLRHQWLVDNTSMDTDASGALSDAIMNTSLALMGKYALDYQNVRIVPSIATYFKMLGLTNVATVDKYGMLATIVTGELMRYRGIPVVPSASQRDTEADGKESTTAGNNTKGQITAYHSGMWYAGFARNLLIEVDKDIRGRKLIMVASFKQAITAHGTRSTNTHTVGITNITV